MIKNVINKTLRRLGVELKKVDKDIFNLKLYKKLYAEKSLEFKRFYNVGAGNFYHPYWTNIDYYSDWYKSNDKFTSKGIHHDLFSLTRIPLDNGIAEIVYSSHTIEHIKDEHAQFFFSEAHRILKNDGLIRITAPDIDLHYRAYKKNDLDFFYWRDWYSREKDYKRINLNQPLNGASIEQLFLQRFATAASILHAHGVKTKISDEELNGIFQELKYEDALNYCCDKCTIEIQKKNPGNHTNWWNNEKVINMLKKAGFKDIWISGHGQSQSPVLRNNSLFDSTHPKISLYIEAMK